MTKDKLLSSDECKRGVERAEKVMAESLADKSKWMEASRERDYYSAALEAAEQREAAEAAAKARAKREAMRPEAEAAGRECMLETLLDAEAVHVREAITILAGVYRRLHERIPQIRAARHSYVHSEYIRYYPIAFGEVSDQVVRDHFGPVVTRALADAELDGTNEFFYPICIAPTRLGRS